MIQTPLTKPWDPGKHCLGEIANGFLLSVGCTIPVEFDTDTAACIMPMKVFDEFFSTEMVTPMITPIYDIQGVMIPVIGIVTIRVEGIQSKLHHEFKIPLNIVVPFLLVHTGERLLLSAKWMDDKHLDILQFMDQLYNDSISNDDGLWKVGVIGPCRLNDAEWDLCSRYHNTLDGHTGAKRLQILIRRDGNDISLSKCEEFIKFCSDCQKASMNWLVADSRINIDNKLLSTVMIDIYFAGDGDPNYRGPKFTYLTICDCTSRTLEIVKVRSLSAISIVNAILKAHVIIPFMNVIWMSDRGTHFMAEAKELLSKLVGNRFQMNYAASHQSQAILERIHEEVNRHLRPLLAFLW